MDTKKPQNIDEYKKWLKEKHEFEISDRTQTYYESVTGRIKHNLEKSDFWIQLTENLKKYDEDYLVKTGYSLLIPEFKPKIYIKSFDSFLLKTFRKNILENKRWPDEPEGEWILPDSWCTKVNDIIRTLFVVKYLDGVEFMIDKIKSLCESRSMECRVFLEAREEGYYAAHVYTKREFEIPGVNWDTEKIDISIEIQITTQLQEVIRRLLHKYYEDKRKGIREEDIKWQWDYKSDEFATNYLGHILHYVEGMIMEIREKQTEEIA
ncbi:hypothetical protein C5S31_11875 [ANME-1 cluster archaeon GoMg2]|nr:hypothetical protein [ANME-1 cluster archaeon GoMg2]